MFGTDTLSADNSDVRLCFDASQKKLSTNPGGKKAYELIKRKKRKTYKALFLVGKDK